MQLVTVRIEKPEASNFILGQTHFIKSVEDLHEVLVAAVPGIKFGLAYGEASGKCQVRWSGTDPAMVELARKNARTLAVGPCLIIFLGEGFYPSNPERIPARRSGGGFHHLPFCLQRVGLAPDPGSGWVGQFQNHARFTRPVGCVLTERCSNGFALRQPHPTNLYELCCRQA